MLRIAITFNVAVQFACYGRTCTKGQGTASADSGHAHGKNDLTGTDSHAFRRSNEHGGHNPKDNDRTLDELAEKNPDEHVSQHHLLDTALCQTGNPISQPRAKRGPVESGGYDAHSRNHDDIGIGIVSQCLLCTQTSCKRQGNQRNLGNRCNTIQPAAVANYGHRKNKKTDG